MTATPVEIPWADVERLAAVLAAAVGGASSGIDRVVGVARGGLIPAVLVAGHLGVRRVEAIQVRHYEGRRRLARPVVLGESLLPSGPSAEGSRTLVVDDVYETGGTLRALGVVLPKARFGVLVAKTGDPTGGGAAVPIVLGPTARPVVAARSAPPDRWVLFPWSGAAETDDGPAPGAPVGSP